MKTKEAKRNEAIERNRQGFIQHRLRWLERQPGGELYVYTQQRHGKEEAEKLKEAANKIFKKAQEQACVDAHGNPTNVKGK